MGKENKNKAKEVKEFGEIDTRKKVMGTGLRDSTFSRLGPVQNVGPSQGIGSDKARHSHTGPRASHNATILIHIDHIKYGPGLTNPDTTQATGLATTALDEKGATIVGPDYIGPDTSTSPVIVDDIICVSSSCFVDSVNGVHKGYFKGGNGGDDVIDCVNINNQLASNHRPIDDNTKDLETERSSYPVEIKMESTSNGELSQGWQKYGKCPEGTVPIRRSTNSITRKHPSPHFNSSLFVGIDEQVHEYAIVKSVGRLFGASATFTVWKPEVEHNEFSLAQIWISSENDENMNTIEVGWIVSPRRYGDDQPRLFTFWTRDGYNTTGCYDHDCAGFVQIDFSIQLGQPIFPSTLGGQLTFLTIMVYKDYGEDGHWWLYVNGIIIGYFPKNLFTSLSEYADRVDFGGEILNKENEGHHTTTQMGNGLYAHENGTSTVSEIKVYDQYRNPVEELHEVFITDSPCYGLLVFGNSIFYGGPGYSAICP
ncbi:uncharacterized protein LOC124943699 [Impatiens glandulifera]|uniref:uncharacterized protein LOC124943699 n=1 Tax=Impatiens glandulifera TaxID=253017 RepID=UPI001FB14DCF|nr:uncharacterized protein LOC124943699 [Impatiens glandulifera]